MKRSWKKKASVWTMATAMTVSYIPQYSFAEETTENIKQETQTQTIEEQTILGNLTSEALATESIPETSLQIPTESSSESVPETSKNRTSFIASSFTIKNARSYPCVKGWRCN